MHASHRPELKQAIIHASVELGSLHGEEGLTMRAIAKRLGISATALYQHFDSKAALLHKIRVYGHGVGQREVTDVVASIDDPIERLRAWGQAYVTFARSHSWLYSVLMEHEQIDFSKMSQEEMAGFLAPMISVRDWLAEGQERGLIAASIEPLTSAMRIVTTMHGLCSLMNSGRVDENHPTAPIRDLPAFIDDFIASIVDALRA